jgi:hypothetical protein
MGNGFFRKTKTSQFMRIENGWRIFLSRALVMKKYTIFTVDIKRFGRGILVYFPSKI